ncbi:flagellar hook-associated protein FlgK [Pseudoduganella sp. DS3]|uniref:Flagellar hook-associated protein 1 n=1 Tax=Pseudoduganella guangdongensis TaxID=2692179 RepID=A0A6N9HJC2_9BURK|nr:flagellar hook-associated protein FlgK [Pseudoduganella guangdongensis]MYN03387.1 flagellar hook-associated protein FlgK [Pseudoduganella guangdongensis]
MSIINNALSGSLAAQAALNTTSQNIANLQTKGYTRQGVILTAVAPASGTYGAGFGVEVSKLIRFSDSYKSQQLWRANSDLGMRTQSQPYFTQLERVMGDEQTSLSNGVDQFFRALNAAGVDPVSSPLRQQVVTAANAMAQSFNSIYNVTRQQQISISQQRDAMLPQLNTLSANIARLNQRITEAGSLGTNTSGLVDERDQAIDALANLVAIEVLEQPDGTRSVSLRSGQPLVAGNLSGTLAMNSASGTPVLELTFAKSVFGLDDTKVGGQLGGIGDYEKNILNPLQQSLVDMADQLAAKVNTQLQAGFKPDGSAGTDLFTFNATGAGGILNITPGIVASDLAFSAAAGEPGNSGNLQALIGIKGQSITLGSIGSVLIGDADTQLVGKLGIDSGQNQSLLETATTIRQQSEDDWAATSSVNKDEEAINLVEFQNMYQANMKVIAVANELFDATLALF